ncbi:MAG: DUF2490 domain-containing protein [Pyrinomonadaceae bacterium]
MSRAAGLMLFALVLHICMSNAQAQTRLLPAPKSDVQEWNEVQLAVPLNSNVDFVLSGTLRFGRHVSRAVDERIGVAFQIKPGKKIGKYLSFAPGYLHIGMQPTEGRFTDEERLSLPITVRFNAGGWTISERNLFERRFRRPQVNATRYRNRLQFEHPVKLADQKLTFFTADEVFYDWSVNLWVRNRFTAGLSKKFNKHFTGDIYYLRQNDGRSRPGDLHVIGTTIRLRTG